MDKPKLTIDLRGPDGNVYVIITSVADRLEEVWAR